MFCFSPEIDGKYSEFSRFGKIDHSLKNKTHKKLTPKSVFGIRLSVTKVTAIETNEGTANGVVRLWERVKAERFALAIDALS